MFYLRFFSRFWHPENFSVNHGCCSGNRFQIERIAQPRIMETFERDRNCFVVSFTDVYVVSIWILRMSHMIASHCCRMIVVGVLYKRRENASDQITIRSSFESDWFRRWRELSGPITRRGQAKSKQSSITFDTQLKNTLLHAECNSKDCLSIKTRCRGRDLLLMECCF